jgi:outer membrane protein assembly factor BamB
LDSGRQNSQPAIGPDGTIYFSMDFGLVAVSPEGDIKWRIMTERRINTPRSGAVIAADSTIYIEGAGFRAINPDSTVKWVFEGGFQERRPLIGKDGTLYPRSGQGTVYALTPEGDLLWETDLEATYAHAVFSPDGSTIYSPHDKKLYAINAANGGVLWSVDSGLNVLYGPMVDAQGNIYYIGRDYEDYICSLTPQGRERWKYHLGYATSPRHTLAAGLSMDWDGFIYIAHFVLGVISLDYEGNLRWKHGDFQAWCPVVADVENKLYVGYVGDPILSCFYQDGTIKFKAELPPSHDISPGAINEHGIMFSVNNGWTVMALK